MAVEFCTDCLDLLGCKLSGSLLIVEVDGFWADVDADKLLPISIELVEESPRHRAWKGDLHSLKNRKRYEKGGEE